MGESRLQGAHPRAGALVRAAPWAAAGTAGFQPVPFATTVRPPISQRAFACLALPSPQKRRFSAPGVSCPECGAFLCRGRKLPWRQSPTGSPLTRARINEETPAGPRASGPKTDGAGPGRRWSHGRVGMDTDASEMHLQAEGGHHGPRAVALRCRGRQQAVFPGPHTELCLRKD